MESREVSPTPSKSEGYEVDKLLENNNLFSAMAEAVKPLKGNLFSGMRYLKDENGTTHPIVAATGQDMTAQFLKTTIEALMELPIDTTKPRAFDLNAFDLKSPIQKEISQGDDLTIRFLGSGEQKVAFLLEFGLDPRKIIVALVTVSFIHPTFNVPKDPRISPLATSIMPAFGTGKVQFATYSDARMFLQIPIITNNGRHKSIMLQEFVYGHSSANLYTSKDPLDFSNKPQSPVQKGLALVRAAPRVATDQLLIINKKKEALAYIKKRGFFVTTTWRGGGDSELRDRHIILEQRPGRFPLSKTSFHPAIIDLSIHDTDWHPKHLR